MTTEERLQRLERQGRLYRHLFILAALGLVAALTYGATQPVPEVIEARVFKARYFNVVDKKGNTVAILGSLPKPLFGGSLTLHNSEGKPIFMAHQDTNHAGVLSISNKTGFAVAEIRVDEYGNGMVFAGNRKGWSSSVKPSP